MFLGIEIGGTKLQLGLGPGEGTMIGLWRGTVDPSAGGDGIRRQIVDALPELLATAGISRSDLRAVGVGFGGPVDDATRTVIKSHQIDGWDNFPLADWLGEALALPVVLGNDADVAGLGEALFGAGKGLSPVFYITVGSGIGGGLILDGAIYRGVGRGAAEIGHLRVATPEGFVPLEAVASGWGMQEQARRHLGRAMTVAELVEWAGQDSRARDCYNAALDALAEGVCHVIALLCPRRVVIGGGVSLIGEDRFFEPLRSKVADRVFRPFAGLTDIVPAALGEAVVVHGALALAKHAARR